MHIESLHTLGSFSGPWLEDDFRFDPRVNLFIGPNALGKTSILRIIESYYSLALERGGVLDIATQIDLAMEDTLRASDDWPRDDGQERWDLVPLLYIPATRVHLPGMTVLWGPEIEHRESARVDDPLEALFNTRSGVFNGHYVERAITWLRYRDHSVILARGERKKLNTVLEAGYSCARSICPEVLRGDAPGTYVEPDQGVAHPGLGVVTADDPREQPLYVGGLSSGAQGTLLWVWALAMKIALHYDMEDGWQECPAILLIDEVENHLHPTWQRRVIPALLEHFRGLQIFATTHSPFVVAGLKAGQVHLLKRCRDAHENEDRVEVTTNTEDIIGWTADEILRSMMGVDEPTDQLTVDRANRLRNLREKEILTLEEESELNELRRQVNEDLLRRVGPLEAQRERYADLMQRFLLAKQSDLNQEGA